MLKFQPGNYRNGSLGPIIGVELDDDGNVRVVIEAQAGETFDDRDVDRSLTPDEARMLAAALTHFADESARRYSR